ncbi:MAG: rhodanese-like domain-containing protein [Desulfohalobiaceae bacterium]
MRSVISITTAELLRLYLLQERFKIMDVRFAYEYNQSKLPEAINVPFDLSHRYGLGQEQKMALLQTLGADYGKMIVIYCRDFR